MDRLEDLLGLLEVGEMSGLSDRLEPAHRERGGVRAPVRFGRDPVALAPDRDDWRGDNHSGKVDGPNARPRARPGVGRARGAGVQWIVMKAEKVPP